MTNAKKKKKKKKREKKKKKKTIEPPKEGEIVDRRGVWRIRVVSSTGVGSTGASGTPALAQRQQSEFFTRPDGS